MRTPTRVLFQIVGHMLREQDVTGITAIHHPLRDVDPGASDVGLLVQITDFIDRAAVNAHPHPQLGMMFQLTADLDRAQDRRFRVGAENERAAVAGGQAEQFALCFGELELLGAPHDLLQGLQALALLGDEQLGVTNNVDEQDVPDLQLDFLVDLGGHISAPTERRRMKYNLDLTADSREQSWPSENDRRLRRAYLKADDLRT
jgi:hypothetical protein